MTEGEVKSGFGTFKGVYTPSILTILGVIMYLRVGWVLGNVGLTQTLLIVTLACTITFLTALSIAATATNMKIGAGGTYYMISRSLGVEPGAAIGLPLFFSQTLGISFYVAGFAESVNSLFPQLPMKAIGVVTLVALAYLAYLSADLALKAQFFILAAIVVSLTSLFLGGAPEGGFREIQPVATAPSFWTVFAVFFPAVTGIEAGIALSGDLKNPSKSLPWGTIAAVLTGFAVYLAIPIFLSRHVPQRVLQSDPLVMRQVAWWGDAIILGVWGATLSSGLASLLGAPRTLQALARDGIVFRFLGRGSGDGDEPRLATVATFFIALLAVLVGDLNMIAPILSMFFLTSYGALNFSAGIESLIASPSWRPTFRIPWALSILGAFGCVATMFMINAGATFIAIFLCAGVFYFMESRQLQAHWGDVRYGILMLLARYCVYRLEESRPDERTWRPNILVLSGSPTSRWYLIELADAITHGRGFLTVAAIVPETSSAASRLEDIRVSIKEYLAKRSVPALVEVHADEETMRGTRFLIKNYGLGPLVPNTILLGETEQPEKFVDFSRIIRTVHRSRRNLVVVREGGSSPTFGSERRVDVWWGLKKDNAGLMLALAYMLTTSPEWGHTKLTLKTVVSSQDERGGALNRLEEFVTRGRLEIEVEVLQRGSDQSPFETMETSSRGAHLVFLGMRPPEAEETPENYSHYYADLLKKTEGYPPTAMVLAAEEINFTRIFD